jgi:hypothetical protein
MIESITIRGLRARRRRLREVIARRSPSADEFVWVSGAEDVLTGVSVSASAGEGWRADARSCSAGATVE